MNLIEFYSMYESSPKKKSLSHIFLIISADSKSKSRREISSIEIPIFGSVVFHLSIIFGSVAFRFALVIISNYQISMTVRGISAVALISNGKAGGGYEGLL